RSDLETLREVSDFECRYLGGHLLRRTRHDLFTTHATLSSGWKQRTSRSSVPSAGGTAARHSSVTNEQRSAKGQWRSVPTTWMAEPGIGANGVSSPIRGIDASRAAV